ncbi:hypothetical protein AAEU42_00960 [Pseudoflavonifractor phocaeensis]|uniref:hypothetical protein n=1 Tax=Pseudoflavonifractor phocaeensis TaxID=1870988 RepID=UPI00313AD62C
MNEAVCCCNEVNKVTLSQMTERVKDPLMRAEAYLVSALSVLEGRFAKEDGNDRELIGLFDVMEDLQGRAERIAILADTLAGRL